MWTKILAVLEVIAEWIKRQWKKQDDKAEIINEAKDKIDNKASGADVHTAIDRMRQR